MSQPEETPQTGKVRAWFHGLGEVLAFFWTGARAVGSLMLGRWPTAESRRRPPAKPPNEGKGLIERIAPFPADD